MSISLKINAGPHGRTMCPVTASVPWTGEVPKAIWAAPQTGEPVPAQVESLENGVITLSWIVAEISARESQTWTLSVCDAQSDHAVSCVNEEGSLALSLGHELVTRYHYASSWARPFFYPVLAPGGLRVTRGYPVVEDVPGEDHDHPHHKSVWISHGDVNGTDNWSELEGHGTTKHLSFSKIVSGPTWCGFASSNDWLTRNGEKILSESREVRLYATSGSERLFDFAITFTASEGDVVFGDTKEGGILSVRVRSTMNGSREGLITNANGGVTEAETWGHKASWCDYSGPADGSLAGITVFEHEHNPLYPTYWHVRDYGLMTANPFALSHYKNAPGLDGSWRLLSGQSATFRYRLLLHLGDADTARIREKYHDYINPPKASLG